jgi:nucleoside-diphosphate-sugar epimerase
MSNVLVTGGSGFLGSLLVRRLLDAGHRVTSVDLLDGVVEDPALESVVGDIRDRPTMVALMRRLRPEVVFHCAARLAHGRISEHEIRSCNAEGTATVADAMIAAGVERIVYTSSNCLWGHGFDHPVGEDEPPAPIEPYGESKWAGEQALSARMPAIRPTIIRCPTIIDEGRLGLLAILFEFIAENRRVWTVGGGGNRYQFVYAADLIDAMLAAWRAPKGGLYGIGADGVGTLRETFAEVIAGGDSRSKIAALPKTPTLLAMRLAHLLHLSPLGPYHYRMIASDFVFDTRRIKVDLGWRPTLTNGEMLLRAYRYYHANRAEIAARTGVSDHRRSAEMGIIRLLKWVS